MTESIKHFGISKVEHVRLRPGMYFGGKDKRALHNMLFEVLDDSIAEIEAGYGDHIWITLGPDSQVTIRDNGRGLPVHMTERGVPMLQVILTDMGGVRVNGTYELNRSMFGVGPLAVSALSAEFVVEVATDGGLWRQCYQQGAPHEEVTRLRDLEAGEPTGTTITFRPDFTILEPNDFDYAMVAERARERAYLHSDLTISLQDHRTASKTEDFHFSAGLVDWVRDLNRGRQVLHDVVSASNEWELRTGHGWKFPMSVQVALQYAETMETIIVGFANNVKTCGGAHTDIIPLAISAIVNCVGSSAKTDRGNYSFDEILPGLTAVVRVTHPQTSLENPSCPRLLNKEVSGIVMDAVYRAFVSPKIFDPTYVTGLDKILIAKCLENRQRLSR